MPEGFVIFRDPETAKIIGWRGHFALAQHVQADETTFYFQPWNKSESLQKLYAEVVESETTVLRTWVKEVQPGENTAFKSTAQDAFFNFVRFIKTGIAQGDFEKIVASRCKVLENKKADIFEAFESACMAYPNAFVSLLWHPGQGLWIGATPERLLYANGDRMETVALAGTLFTEAQKWSDKEAAEQGIISKFVKEVLQKNQAEQVQVSALEVAQQSALSHLEEKIGFQLPQNKLHFLLNDLHPTPAVGGYPQATAIHFIERFENLERQLFTGWFGWCKDGVFSSWVNLRCARIFSNHIVQFAGCGINAGSDPEKEWMETEAKMEVIGRFLQT